MAAAFWVLILLSCLAIFTRSDEECGRHKTGNKIIHGNRTELGEFPWMALLLYGEDDIVTACGGSLISRRYVLTAAHCTTGRTVSVLGNLTMVRLGEYDLQTEEDCETVQSETTCAPKYEDIPVESLYIHPNYNSSKRGYNDIALVKLAKEATYGDFVKPLCLPDDSALRKIGGPRTYFTTAGWGVTEHGNTSSVLLKAKVPLAINRTCGETHICAGGGMTDSCNGDSGGPLMFLNKGPDKLLHWYLAGITSFGPSRCGSLGKPGTYTRTSGYLEWINSVIKS